MTTNEVASLIGVSRSLIIKWCLKNNIERKLGKQGVMEYDLTNENIEAFKNREKKLGWKKGRPRKTDCK